MEALKIIGDNFILVLSQTWWVVLPLVLFFILIDLWVDYKKSEFIKNINFTVLEIIIPKEMEKSPQAMEQVFAGLTVIPGEAKTLKDKYITGKVPYSITFEIASISGSVRFFARVPSDYRNLVESYVYAQYPSAEISIVDDYTERFPKEFPWDAYNIAAAEFKLSKADAYPIRTYPAFKFDAKEEQIIDPMANMLESFSSLQEGEEIWFQIYITPTDSSWLKSGEELVEKLMGKKKSVKPKVFSRILLGFANIITEDIFGLKPGEPEKPVQAPSQSPGQKAVVEAIEKNIAKIGLKTGIRALYIARKEIFSSVNLVKIVGALAQFNTQDLNGFTINSNASSKSKLPGSWGRKSSAKKLTAFYEAYKTRKAPKGLFVFNTEELATIYHFPGGSVMAPMMPRVEAKKSGPPANLPTL